MKKKVLGISFLAFSLVTVIGFSRVAKQAEWTILTYMQADNNLAPFAGYNVKNMQRAGYNKGVHVLVQWIKPDCKTAGRYVLTKGDQIKEEVIVPTEETLCPQTSIINAMKWAKRNYPAKHYLR